MSLDLAVSKNDTKASSNRTVRSYIILLLRSGVPAPAQLQIPSSLPP